MAEESLGAQIANARNARGLTQAELAERFGKGGSERTIQDWENNRRRPHPNSMAKLRMLLEWPADESETRDEWPARVQTVTQTLGELLAPMPAEDLRRWRSAFIRRFVQRSPASGIRADWPDDVEIIVDLIGQYLIAGTDYED